MADLFDNHIYATETAHFGVVSDNDSNGRIGIVVTKQINVDNGDGPQVVGFVNPCDFFTREETGVQNDLHTSNEGEFFYAIAPDPDSIVGQAQDTDRLFDFLPVVIAHEFAHMIQFSHRFTQTGEFMALFMAEGMATPRRGDRGSLHPRKRSRPESQYCSGSRNRRRPAPILVLKPVDRPDLLLRLARRRGR